MLKRGHIILKVTPRQVLVAHARNSYRTFPAICSWNPIVHLSVTSGAVRPLANAASKAEGTGIRNAGWRAPLCESDRT
jgi:hypothetical protein